MVVAGWLLIAGMIGLFISSDIILFKTIRDRKKYPIKNCYAVSIIGYSALAWIALLSLLCIYIMEFNHFYITEGIDIPFTVLDYIYGILLLLLPLIQFVITTIGTVKYTVSVLDKKWWHPVMSMGIGAAGFCLVFAIVSKFL